MDSDRVMLYVAWMLCIGVHGTVLRLVLKELAPLQKWRARLEQRAALAVALEEIRRRMARLWQRTHSLVRAEPYAGLSAKVARTQSELIVSLDRITRSIALAVKSGRVEEGAAMVSDATATLDFMEAFADMLESGLPAREAEHVALARQSVRELRKTLVSVAQAALFDRLLPEHSRAALDGERERVRLIESELEELLKSVECDPAGVAAMVAKWREVMIETAIIARQHIMAITFVNEAKVETAQFMDLSSQLAGLLAKAYGTSIDPAATYALVKRLARAEAQLKLADRIVHKALHPAVNARRAEKRFKRAMFFAGTARETFLCLALELGEWCDPTDKEDDFFHL